MCCDGSLFDNVRLGSDEDAGSFKLLGLPVRRSRAKVPVAYFNQPCRALCEDLTCKVYAERPSQCRRFECGVYKGVESGELPLKRALAVVKKSLRKANQVRGLLDKIDGGAEALAIGARFRRVERWVNAGKLDAEGAEVFADLGLAMHQLDMLAHEWFYTEEE